MATTTTLGLFSHEELQASTGKSWADWMEILDGWDSDQKGLITTTDYLRQEYALEFYWAQALAICYLWQRLGVTLLPPVATSD